MMDAVEFLRERALAMGTVMGGREPWSCDPYLIKTNWFDKRHRVNAYKEIWVLILNSNISYFNTIALYANFNSSY